MGDITQDTRNILSCLLNLIDRMGGNDSQKGKAREERGMQIFDRRPEVRETLQKS
jgi:hypothetical protein